MEAKKYPGKILLLGEYTVLLGGNALALPSTQFFGTWSQEKVQMPDISAFISFLASETALSHFLDLPGLVKAFESNHLWLETNIPVGYGLGSSGVLCAALLDRFKKTEWIDLRILRRVLSGMEAYFHGSSSGIDPLVSYTHTCIVKESNMFGNCGSSLQLNQFFLLDSGQARSTRPWVNLFKEKIKSPAFKDAVQSQWLLWTDRAIMAVIQNDANRIRTLWKKISAFQLTHLSEMIPEHLQSIWREGLEADEFLLKLCGAGGGGMFLVMGDPLVFSGQYPKISTHPL